jgi:hypothetical protein
VKDLIRRVEILEAELAALKTQINSVSLFISFCNFAFIYLVLTSFRMLSCKMLLVVELVLAVVLHSGGFVYDCLRFIETINPLHYHPKCRGNSPPPSPPSLHHPAAKQIVQISIHSSIPLITTQQEIPKPPRSL